MISKVRREWFANARRPGPSMLNWKSYYYWRAMDLGIDDSFFDVVTPKMFASDALLWALRQHVATGAEAKIVVEDFYSPSELCGICIWQAMRCPSIRDLFLEVVEHKRADTDVIVELFDLFEMPWRELHWKGLWSYIGTSRIGQYIFGIPTMLLLPNILGRLLNELREMGGIVLESESATTYEIGICKVGYKRLRCFNGSRKYIGPVYNICGDWMLDQIWDPDELDVLCLWRL